MNSKKRARNITRFALLTAILLACLGLGSSRAGAPKQTQTVENGPGWTLITIPDVRFEDGFGYSAAVDAGTLVVSAPGTPLPDKQVEATIREISAGGLAGAVYIFQRAGEDWTDAKKLTPGDAEAGDQFGVRLALSGDTLAVSAPYKWTLEGGNASGVVYIFKREGEGWTQQAKLSAPDGAPFDLFGNALALKGDTLAVGARAADSAGKANSGAVYVFQRQGEEWSLQSRLAAEEPAARDYFGESILLTEDALIIGAPGHDENASDDNFGGVYLFRGSGKDWQPAGMLSTPDLGKNGEFGYSLALNEHSSTLVAFAQNKGPVPDLGPESEDYASLVNYTGGAYLFAGQGTDWRYQERLIPEQQVYAPFYFVREARLTLNESDASEEYLILAMTFTGTYLFERQGEGWNERTWPRIPYKDTGANLGGWFLGMSEDVLVLQTWHPVETDVPAILLIDLAKWRENQ
jgi:hypothetical protein